MQLAHAAVSAARWPLATQHLEAARLLVADAATLGRAAVLEAEIALAQDDLDRADQLASQGLSAHGPIPEVACQALEVRGRVARLSDLTAARALFEQALSIAQLNQLSLWQVRAMHELGTIDMFDHAGTERLVEARRTAAEFGALSTAAVVDLQLSAVRHSRFELALAADSARSALALSERLALGQVRAKALAMLAENAGWRGQREEMERYIGLMTGVARETKCWLPSRGGIGACAGSYKANAPSLSSPSDERWRSWA